MKISDLKIGARLSAGIALLLALMALMAGIGLWNLHQSAAAYDRQAERLQRTTLSTELAGLVNSSGEMIISHLTTQDPVERTRLEGKMAAENTRALEILKLLSANADEADRQALAELGRASATFRAVRAQVMDAKQRGELQDPQDLNKQIADKLVPCIQAYQAALKQYSAATMEAAREASAQAEAVAARSRNQLMASGLIALVIGVLVGWLLTRSITRPIIHAVKAAGVIASGDLTQRIEVRSRDETGQLLEALRSMNNHLASTVGQIRTEASAMKDDAELIADSASQVSTAADRQSEATASMAAAVEQLTVSVTHISDAADQTQQNSEGVSEKCAGGEIQVANAADSMQRIASAVAQAADKIRGLEARATQISAAAAAIKDIADQTNLLALNAAIEAARAGDQGRGFSVVADEVRKLAERTASATVEIEEMVAAVQRETTESTEQITYVLPLVQEGTKQADQVAVSLREISDSAQASLERAREVAHATKEQSSASTAIAQQVESIAQMVEETTAAMASTAHSAGEMREMANRLNSLVNQFRV